jgi:nucleotide-binding universal stress UspA family protein
MGAGVAQRIVVGVDREEAATNAMDVAIAEAAVHRLPLHLVGTVDAVTPAMRRAQASAPGLVLIGHAIAGDAAEALVDESRTAAVVVVGEGSPAPDTSSSASSWVAAHCHCPVIVVAPAAQACMHQPVLVGVAGEADEDRAVRFAFDEADARRVSLRAVYVWSGVPAAGMGCVEPYEWSSRQAFVAADRMLSEALAGWADKYPEVDVERLPCYDLTVARGLLDASAEAGLLVVGARRRPHVGDLVLGSVTRTLIHRARCPVAVVRLTDG